ncbi:MAG TPA: phospholipid carrier-dependent glycosyltransferase [Polyangia bacterium]|nr:phospholipid carrier-dependent glycosyltransferase [Polyangia bacterium]
MRALARLEALVIAALLLAVVATYVAAGRRGVGFGRMYDEEFQLGGIEHTIDPVAHPSHGYYYGGLYFLPGELLVAPTLLRAAPAIVAEVRAWPTRPFDQSAYPSLVDARRRAADEVADPTFVEADRTVFVVIVALTIVWVFVAGWAATGSAWVALAVAGVVGTSWELSYHGRWIAVDSMLAQFTALELALVSLATRPVSAARERWLLLASAVAAGLGLGSKTTGVFLTLPIFIALALSPHVRGARAWLRRALEASVVMFAVFVATTPGFLFEPLHYANDLFLVTDDYNRFGTDHPYGLPRVIDRLAAIGGYWTTALFSPHIPVALGVSALALVGAVVGVRERQPKVLATLGFLVAYVAFVSMQRLLIVRNLMLTLPPLALLAAVGLRRGARAARRWRAGPLVVGLACAAVCGLDGVWIWRAASTIGATNDDTILASVEDHLLHHKGDRVYVAPALRAALATRDGNALAGAKLAAWDDADAVMAYARTLSTWRANTPEYATYFGSQHANYDYYPTLLTWPTLKPAGNPVVLISKAKAAALGVTEASLRQ